MANLIRASAALVDQLRKKIQGTWASGRQVVEEEQLEPFSSISIVYFEQLSSS